MNKKWLIIGTISFSVGLSLSLVINRDIKQAALTGLLSVPVTVAGVSVTERQRKQKLNDKISTLQGLVQKEANLNNSIALLSEQVESLKQQEESITAVISTLNIDYQRYLQLATRSQSELETIQNQVYELSNRKSSLEPEVITLEVKLQQLKEQETRLTKLLADLSNSQQQTEVNLESDRHTYQQLQKQKINLEENINNLVRQKHTLAEQLNSQQHSLNQLQQQKLDLENVIANIYNDKQKLEKQFEERQKQLFNETKNCSYEYEASYDLDDVYSLDADFSIEFDFEQENNADDFRNAKYINHLWENTILPYWNHKDRRAGYRFLGNVSIEPTESDRLISIVGKNLQKLDCIGSKSNL